MWIWEYNLKLVKINEFFKRSTLTKQGTIMHLLLVIQVETQKSDGKNSSFSESILDVVAYINKQEIGFNKFYQRDDAPSIFKRLAIINKLEEFGLSLTTTETVITTTDGATSCISYFFRVLPKISEKQILKKIRKEFCIP